MFTSHIKTSFDLCVFIIPYSCYKTSLNICFFVPTWLSENRHLVIEEPGHFVIEEPGHYRRTGHFVIHKPLETLGALRLEVLIY